jgi:crooked neck
LFSFPFHLYRFIGAMSLPKPPIDLKGHCSILHNNTLYVYTPSGLLSLALERDAEWVRLGQGVPVTGATCVKGRVDGDRNHPALYVVGGKSDSPDYPGLQRYSLLDRRWRTIPVVTPNIRNRVRHGATFINSVASILVYAGTQVEDPNPSSQTFLLAATPPYSELSSNSFVPPAISPLIFPWGEDQAIMVGGGPDNNRVFSFSSATGAWQDTGATLPSPLPDKSKVQCATVLGNDGSKILLVFDMSAEPNTVTRYVLLMPGGSPAAPGQTIGDPSRERLQPRQLSLTNYPAYNGTFAPKTARTGFSLAQDVESGLIVLSGGNSNEPISIFNQTRNGWVDTTELFNGRTTSTTSSISSTRTPTSTGTNTVSATASASAVPPKAPVRDNKLTITIVASTLGVVLGIAAVIIILLLIIAWKKRRDKYGGVRERSHGQDRLSFQDQGMEPLTKAVQPMGRGPARTTDSWAIVSSQAEGQPRRPQPTALGDFNFGIEKNRSPLRNMESNVSDGLTKETGGTRAAGGVRTDRLTDEGWGKYFQGNADTKDGRSMRSSASSVETKSDYGDWPHASAEVPPLTLKTIGNPQPVGGIKSFSPRTEQTPRFETQVTQRAMTAKISSADSISIASDDSHDRGDAFSSGVPASVHDESGWGTSARFPFMDGRVPSSNYSGSMYYQGDQQQSLGLGAPSNDHRLTQWPDMQKPRDDKKGHSSKLSSDVSWLNLGNNR